VHPSNHLAMAWQPTTTPYPHCDKLCMEKKILFNIHKHDMITRHTNYNLKTGKNKSREIWQKLNKCKFASFSFKHIFTWCFQTPLIKVWAVLLSCVSSQLIWKSISNICYLEPEVYLLHFCSLRARFVHIVLVCVWISFLSWTWS